MKKTIKVSRWVNIYPEEQGKYMNTEKSAKDVASPRCLATIELKGEYEIEVPEKRISLSESELRGDIREIIKTHGTVTMENALNVYMSKLFGGDQ